MKQPFKLIGYYEPARNADWKSWLIGKKLTGMTAALGLKPHKDPVHGPQDWVPWVDEALHAEVRIWTVANKQGAQWHQDGDTTPGAFMDCALVLWADWKPTEFLFNGAIFQPKPYELIIARNLACTHRRPPELRADSQRWVFRQRVKVPKEMELP